jgi:hypothetical protein
VNRVANPNTKKIIFKYFKSPYIGLKNAKNIFQKTPQICFYRGKINQVGEPVSDKLVFHTLSAVMRLLSGKSCPWRNPGLTHTWLSVQRENDI